MFNINSKLKLYRDNITNGDMLEKKHYLLFMHWMCSCSNNIENVVLKKYCELISYLLVAEQNNKLLMKNHESWLTGSTPFFKVNAMRYNNNYAHGCACSRGSGHGHGRKRINFHNYNGHGSNKPSWNKEKQEKGYITEIPRR